ncbi:MAG: endonuclease domain-containing protein [Saprospiraceae bacterium]|nr:endonuclease domain-containing protein [Saprospiraceae bacterium]MBK8546060.1 endonuclease domain-containing protein [Saprospiraceae bacterium]MBK8818139.1 endonuclease domain-containing protein [Saprospiraceae bacterium]MBK9043022.1 endonuclease domain-containing protein [Saprospiraceae bacterium]
MEEEKPNMHRNASGQIFRNAIELRKNLTKAEEKIWQEILYKRPLGYKFRFQHPFFIYILDFYCHKLRLAIEIDGSIHDEPDQKIYDVERDNLLMEEGLKVIRIRNESVLLHFDDVQDLIIKVIKERELEII